MQHSQPMAQPHQPRHLLMGKEFCGVRLEVVQQITKLVKRILAVCQNIVPVTCLYALASS